MRSSAGRADLLRILVKSPESLEYAARALGYEKRLIPPEPVEINVPAIPGCALKGVLRQTAEISFAASGLKPLVPTLFWQLIEYEQTNTVPAADQNVAVRPTRWEGLEQKTPRPIPLCPWPTLMPRLRAALAEPAVHRDPDIPAIVRLISTGKPIYRWPRRSRQRWPLQLQIVEDFATRLTPLWTDQKLVTHAMARLLPRDGLDHTRLNDGLHYGVIFGRHPGDPDLIGMTGASILVISDLGLLGAHPRVSLREWMQFALERKAEGKRCIALTPAPPTAYPPAFRSLWTLVQWDHSSVKLPNEKEREEQADRLLGLLSYCVKIPPGLVRDVRHLLPKMSAVSEIDLWRSASIISPHPSAATMSNADKKTLHEHFHVAFPERPDLQHEIFKKIKYWCGGERESIYLEAVLGLGASAKEVVDPDDYQAALSLVKDMAAHEAGDETDLGPITPEQIMRYFRDMRDRTHNAALQIEELREPYSRLCDVVAKHYPTAKLPVDYRPAPAQRGSKRRSFELKQKGGHLVAATSGEVEAREQQSGSFLAIINTCIDELYVWPTPFWKSSAPPHWATDYGTDEYGPWAEFAVAAADGGTVSQRMRWIVPGRFLMGSPEGEPGRYAKDESGVFFHEGPQHEVRLSTGYWLFDAPVTQELWTAVMGDNPSRFKHPKRPVEQVSWDDAAQFIERVNQLVPGLDLVLPTEAQWEYACRAGTDTATYAGPIQILGTCNAPVLDEIAWYTGNSGVGFELDNGYDSADWPEKQYEHDRAGTHPVKKKRANPWGLHDMLGNVWEWCADDIRKYTAETTTDPVGDLSGAQRALRGGSWHDDARFVRAASRDADDRDYRDDYFGFRCARVRAGAEPAEPGPGRAERQTAPGRRGGAELLALDGRGGKTSVELPKGRTFVVRSDCETLTFAPVSRHDAPWASAMGRDRYGLWAEFTLAEITQRMRWIGPGRFLMGSPEDEPGRYGKEVGDWNEGPQHEVRLSKGYWLFDTPVTQALWMAVMGDNPSNFKDKPTHPVEQVSWDDTSRFIEQINARASGLDLSLPTEAQWEYACRAGTVTPNYVGGEKDLGDIAWFSTNSSSQTQPVAMKRCNAWGLHDMLGNVWEWCADDLRMYGDDAVTDPVGDLSGAGRALRGSCWSYDARDVRAAYRDAYSRASRNYDFGFRCARVRP